MSTRRSLISLVLMSLTLVALIVDGMTNGWRTSGIVAVSCFVIAVAAQLLALGRARAGHR